jgi:hypothetical protein
MFRQSSEHHHHARVVNSKRFASRAPSARESDQERKNQRAPCYARLFRIVGLLLHLHMAVLTST